MTDLFPALKIRDYRLFWMGWLISQMGSWMQNIAWGWLVFDLTNSALWLGVVGFCGSIPSLFLSPFSGAIADRMQKRTILLTTQAVFMALAFILAGLVFSGLIRVWQIILIALLNGITFGIDAPVRQAYAPTLAGKENLMNAIGLNSMAFNTARILGPAIAGVLIAKVGPAGCFLINGVSFLAVLIALANIRSDGGPAVTEMAPPFWSYFGQGFRYLTTQRDMLMIMLLVAVVSIFGNQYNTLLPIFARNIFHGGPRALGLLSSSIGCGALIGALGATQFHRLPGKGRIIIIAGLAFVTALFTFAHLSSLAPACVALGVVGFAIVSFNTTNNALVQTMAEENLRGRMVGFYMLCAVGLGPFGALLAGALASAWGAPAAVSIGAAVCAACLLLVLLIRPSLVKLRG